MPNQSRWIKIIATNGNVRGVAIQATSLVQEMARMHGLGKPGDGPDVAQALGEATIAALLVSSYCKAGERVNLNIRGTGWVSQALVDAHPEGTARGYVIGRKGAYGSGATAESLGPWGEGTLSVLRAKGGAGEQPYIGTVPLITGHLAKDLTFYWHQSEQIPSAVGLAVTHDDNGISSAGGFLVQALPGASASEINEIDGNIHAIQSLASQIALNGDPLILLSQIFQSTAFMIIEEKNLRFECNCSRERVRRALALVGTEELKDMLDKDKGASVRCDFCAKQYTVDSAELKQMIGTSSGK